MTTLPSICDDLRAVAVVLPPRDPVARWARGVALAHAFAAGLFAGWVAQTAMVDEPVPAVATRAELRRERRPVESGKAREDQRRKKELTIESDLPSFTAVAGWERELLLPFVRRLVDDVLADNEETEA